MELLIALADKSLLKLTGDVPVRYQMLETIREYGVERLAEREELAALRLRHARYFSELTQQHAAALRTSDQLYHLQVLEIERDNVLSALAYLCDAGEPHESVDMAYQLCWYWTMLGRHSEARRWLHLVLDSTGGYESPRRSMVEAMYVLNSMASNLSGSEVEGWSERMEQLYHRLGEVDATAEPLVSLMRAILTFFSGVQERTLGALEPAMSSVRSVGAGLGADVPRQSVGERGRAGEDA